MPRELATEGRQHRLAAVETRPDADILKAIAEGQAAAIAAAAAVTPVLAEAAALLAATWRQGGRIAYAGAGSSGYIGLLDALELPGTYGMARDRLPVLLAGGAASLDDLGGAHEDDTNDAAAQVRTHGLGTGDVVIAISASGHTGFTLAAAKSAKAAGARIVGIACNAPSPLLEVSDIPVALLTGPEVIAGSTRMNAGTAQKCALNMLSTLTALRLHHVHDGMMINVRPENAKLRDRLARIVSSAAAVDRAAAEAALDRAGGSGKVAVLLATGASPEVAQQLLTDTGGDVRAALHAFSSRA